MPVCRAGKEAGDAKNYKREKLVVNVTTNLKYFGERTKWDAAIHLDS